MNMFVAILAVALSDASTPAVVEVEHNRFDARAAWTEFEDRLRSQYAYVDRLGGESAERQLSRSRTLAAAAPDRVALIEIFKQTARTFADPHLLVGPLEDGDFNVVYTSADIKIAFDGSRYDVLDVRAGSAAAAAGVRPGWRLRAVDGADVSAAARAAFADVLTNPDLEQLSYGATMAANGRRGRSRELVFENLEGEPERLVLPSPQAFAREVGTAPPLSVQRLGAHADIALVRFNNSLGRMETIEAFDAAVAEHLDARAFILDLRNTPSGGNTDVARAVIGHFIERPQPYQMHTIPAVERDTGVPRRFIEIVEPRPPYVDGKLVVLHGAWTGSMGEGLVIGLHAAADAVTIGSDMGDLLGALWSFDLEHSEAWVEFGGEALFHVDGTPREDFIADIAAAQADTAPDGSDPLLPLALEHLASPP